MSQPIAIGVGCRLGCGAPTIERAIRLALDRIPDGAAIGLFSIADKRGEAGLAAAADLLGLPLVLLPRAALRDQAASVETDSPASRRRFGVPSVAEAAALAGAGPDAVLLVPRIAVGGATCAIAGTAVALTEPDDPSRCVRRSMAGSEPGHDVEGACHVDGPVLVGTGPFHAITDPFLAVTGPRPGDLAPHGPGSGPGSPRAHPPTPGTGQ